MNDQNLPSRGPSGAVDVREERSAALDRPTATEPVEDAEVTAWIDIEGPCGWVMLLCAFALIASEWTLMTDSLNGQNNGYIDTAAAIVLGLAGLRCLSPGLRPIAGSLAALAGVGLLLQAVFASEQSIGLHIVRYGIGGIAVVAGLTVLLAARQVRRRVRAGVA